MKLENLLFKEMTIPRISYFLILFGFLFVMLGTVANFKAIQSNEGRMPVWSGGEYYDSERHFSIQDVSEVKHIYFADIYPIKNSIWSIGDFSILFGIVLLITGAFIFGNQVIIKIIIKHKGGQKNGRR